MKIERKSVKIMLLFALSATLLSSCSRGYGCPYEFSLATTFLTECAGVIKTLISIF